MFYSFTVAPTGLVKIFLKPENEVLYVSSAIFSTDPRVTMMVTWQHNGNTHTQNASIQIISNACNN